MKSRHTSIFSPSENILHPSVGLPLLLSANLWKVFLRTCRKTEEMHVSLEESSGQFYVRSANFAHQVLTLKRRENRRCTQQIELAIIETDTCEREAQKKINTRCPLRSQLQLSDETNQKERGTFVSVPSSASENCLQGNDCIRNHFFKHL